METILLVGGGGFVGQHLAADLVENGYRVYATHRAGSPPPLLRRVHWIPTKLTSDSASITWPIACDRVIFLAQARGWRDFPETAPEVLAVNVAGLVRVAEYARRAGARQLIYASSGSVYSQTREVAHEREPIDSLANRSFYAASKLAGELLLRPYDQMFRVVILRLFTPYGLGQSPDMLLPSLVRNVREHRSIKLHHPDGLIANPLAVRDAAEAMRRCLSLDRSATLNVGGPERLTLRDIGETIGEVLGVQPVFESQPGTPPVIVGDNSALRNALGWSPSTDLESGLRDWLQSGIMTAQAAG